MQLNEFITAIQAGDEQSLDWLYRSYRGEFVEWAMKQYRTDEEVALDAFQEGVVSFYYNIKNDKVKASNASIKTYLFAIAKNILFNKLRKTKFEVSTDYDIGEEESSWEMSLFDVTERQEFLANALNSLGQNCRKLLQLFYFDGNSMEAIASKLGYKSENVAKTQKMRCLQALRKIVKG